MRRRNLPADYSIH